MNPETKNISERVRLRPVMMPDDEEFLIELYYTTREDFQSIPIAEELKKNLSLMQYRAQKEHYAEQFPGSKHDIILLDGEIVGRLWTWRGEAEIVGVDLIILPEYRSLGIGTMLLRELFDESEDTGKIFTFHVLKTNFQAIRLYQRLNCEFTGETVSHYSMRRLPADKR
jgi:ribosomal protein S18 acetylase RimI-like enzyme